MRTTYHNMSRYDVIYTSFDVLNNVRADSDQKKFGVLHERSLEQKQHSRRGNVRTSPMSHPMKPCSPEICHHEIYRYRLTASGIEAQHTETMELKQPSDRRLA